MNENAAERIAAALAAPDFSHTTRRSWCGREILYFYRREPSSPSGVYLFESVEATDENLRLAGRVHNGPTRGDVAASRWGIGGAR